MMVWRISEASLFLFVVPLAAAVEGRGGGSAAVTPTKAIDDYLQKLSQ